MIPNELEEGVRRLVERAVRAPSSHNTQPWIFRLSGSDIDLLADRTRALPINDRDDRELLISCGCALLNLRIAAAGEGWGTQVKLLPEPTEPDLLARTSLSCDSPGPATDARLAEFIECRRTYRKRFAPSQVSPMAVEQMKEACRQEGARLIPLLSDEARLRAAVLVAEGDAAQWSDPRWRRELAAWMHPRRRGDGLSIPALAAPFARLVVRAMDLGGGVGAKDRAMVVASPFLAVLGTDRDDPRDWLRAGQALQRALLVACQFGLQASYFNQPIQVPSLRPELQKLAPASFPQILLRLGQPVMDIPAAPRRAIDEIVEVVYPC